MKKIPFFKKFSKNPSEKFTENLNKIPYKKTIALFLVFVLIFSQTFHFNFFGTANASADLYRDIVSIIIDRETHNELKSKINTYASDIQKELGATRTIISVIDENTTPAMIAAQNEKWYYEQEDEDGVKTRLVGTILIGNVPIPMVNAQGKYFPSVFPYVDFEDKAFVYNEKSDRFEQVSAFLGSSASVEIWHGVMNPAVGRLWEGKSDIEKIEKFLDKTHNFYEKTGRFAIQTEQPRVFYFDGFSENKSTELRRVFQYALRIKNAENLAYNRFSKYLLEDINKALKDYDVQNNEDYVDLIKRLGIDGIDAEIAFSNTLSSDFIKTTPDIQTTAIIKSLLLSFDQIFNTKVLGEELAAIHNAGRYNSGSVVNADIGAVNISIIDDIAKDTLKKANDALEESFNEFLKENSIARRIPIVDSISAKYGKAETMIPYANYFFGNQGKNILSANQCSIARGTNQDEKPEFGKSILVESNSAFDVNSTEKHIEMLKGDEANCYGGGKPALGTFWGGNSLLRVANNTSTFENGKNPLTEFPAKNFQNFTQSIFSQEGMLESDRVAIPSLATCIDYSSQYTLKQPYSWRVYDEGFFRDKWRHYPSNTNGAGFRCNSEVDVIDGNRKVFDERVDDDFLDSSRNVFESASSNDTIPVRPDENFFKEMERYNGSTACLVGTLSIDGQNFQNNNPCISSRTDDGDIITANKTNYRNLAYHTIEGILYHISPTEEELQSAEKNGVTPNLPININRSIEFITKKGNIVVLQYPNFFRMNADNIAEVREWLRQDSERQWQAILQKENQTEQSDIDAQISENILKAKNLPETFDWNNYISDEFITQVLQAKNWLHPDITKKYRDTIEASLSYSGNPSDGNIFSKIPQTSENAEKTYEIAYFGLSDINPGNSNSNDDVKNLLADYNQKLSAIHGYNISEQEKFSQNNPSSSAQCGPAEGVDLFKWPSAIQCWIKTQIPVKIHGGQCGGATIGGDYTNSKPSKDLSTENIENQKNILKNARVIPHFDRTHTSYHSALDFSVSLQNDENKFIPNNGSTATFEVISLHSDGKKIPKEDFGKFFEITTQTLSISGTNTKFLISTKNKDFTLEGKIIYSLLLSDGTREKIESEKFTLINSSAYLDAYISSDNANGVAVVSADSSENFYLNIFRKKSLGGESSPEKDFSIKFFDDITNREITTITGSDGQIRIPDVIGKNIGVYRAVITGKDGISGEMTFSVSAGEIAQIKILPASTMIVKDSATIATLSLQDQNGNAVKSDLYSVEIFAENGFIIDSAGNPQKNLKIDIFDSRLTFSLLSEKSGKMKISAIVKSTSATGNKEFKTEREIEVLDEARVKLQFENIENFVKIGSTPLKAQIKITDANGNLMSGFSSAVALSLPSGAGTFSSEMLDIKNGQTEPFTFSPGNVAGTHNLTINIPGIGIISDTPLTLVAGDAMYIDHTAQNGFITFSLRDRFGNLTAFSGQGFLTENSGSPIEIRIENGQFSLPEKNGYYILEVPEMSKNIIEFEENGEKFQILPISKYAVQIFSGKNSYNFAEDYNARYSVFAGGEYLREAEDVVFHTDPNNSQSLAATTLMASPFAQETLLSVFPSGGYSVGRTDDSVIESVLELERGFPVMKITDSVRKQEIARVLYQMNNAELIACAYNQNCENPRNSAKIFGKILLTENDGYKVEATSGQIIFSKNNSPIITIAQNGSIQKANNITLRLKPYNTTQDFSFEILENGAIIAEASYYFNEKESVISAENIFAESSHNSPIIASSGYQISRFDDKNFASGISGVTIKKSLSSNIFDSTKIGPTDIDDIGTLSENPSVGWMGENRMLLSFAAGDTIGEATKWFHTYMMLNMGDPVASVRHGEPNTQIDGLDRSIGMQIADSRKSQIADFFQKDMNNDGLIDILVQYSDGYIELFLNISGKFRSLGHIAYLPQFQSSLLQFGDFNADGFSDIVSIDKSGKLHFISNKNSKFSHIEVKLTSGIEAPSHISQWKIYDMDADKKDDIAYLTSGGQLGILYGTENSGIFEQKILDATLGISLRNETEKHGGAIISDKVPQPQNIIGRDSSHNPPADVGLTDAKIREQVYYQETKNISKNISSASLDTTLFADLAKNFTDSTLNPDLNVPPADNITSTTPVPLATYIRSQYATLHGIEIAKKYTSPNATLFPEDSIVVEISLKNIFSEPQKNVKYLDSISKIFTRDASLNYEIEVGGQKISKNFVEKNIGDYSLEFDIGEIPANSEAKIRYTLKVLPASYGEMLVGDFEKGLAGHDNYGDIAFKTSTTCGAEMMTWLSREAREYDSSRRPATFTAIPYPKNLEEKIRDADKNGIPDSVENMTPAEGKKQYDAMNGTKNNSKNLVTLKKEGKSHIRIGFDEETSRNIESKAQEIADGLSCGFGGGSCMSFPINWAPLAPGNDPVIFGSPMGDGFRVHEGIPVFSALTTRYTSFGPIPSVWPPSSSGAGGYFGEVAPYSSFVRLFVTPTLTLGMGGAVCLGSYPSIVGNMPPKGLSPLVQGGNCIVMAKPMPVCQGDGSIEDGDISGVSGLGVASQGRAHSTTEVWNGESCNLQASAMTTLQEDEKKLEAEILSYMRSPSEKQYEILGITTKISKRNISSLNGGPLLNIGNAGVGSDIEISIQGSDSIADISKVIDVKNKRISAFPDFIMDWLTRQTEELTNSLFTPPNLTIIPPTDFGQNAKVDGSYSDFIEKLESAYSKESFDSMKAEMSTAYNSSHTSLDSITSSGNSRLSQAYSNFLQNSTSSIGNSANNVEGGLNAMRSAYTFIGKLPFLNIRQTKININIPWILPRELDQYERRLKDYQIEIENATKRWCASGETKECLEAKVKLNSSGFYSSIQANLKRIEEYRKFPEKIQKYVTWKEKLLYDILCNIQAVEKMTFGWIKENGVRFQKWAELYILIKAIAESWQPLLDIFAETNAQCGVCRNERHNSQKWKFKLISAIIPKIPVISFPKWPDIVLDLSDVRLGIDIAVPDFNFRISPLRLPMLPSLSLPNSPNASFSLPTLPVLPALPSLPDLPELPSLPMVDLPDLPPPPKLPKLGGSIKASLDILKLISKLYCYYQKTSLIPEWQVGDVIAQRTERQGTLPMDFLDIQFPQFSLPTIKEIRISTHLNYMLRSDFISEFAKNAVKPINEFTTDLQNHIPSRIDALEKGADAIENVANQASDAVHNAVDNVENSANNIRNSLQNSSNSIQNRSDAIENNLQNSSDNLEENAQNAVDNAVSYENFSKNFNAENIENILEPIIAKLEAEKDIFLDTDEFAFYFKSQLLASGFTKQAYDIDYKMSSARIESQKLQKEIEDYNREKFNLLYEFINEESRKAGEMQNIVDLLRSDDSELLALSPYVANFASLETENSSLALRQLANLENSALKNFSNNSENISAKDIGISLQNRIHRIAQLTSTEQNNVPTHSLSTPVANSYLPNFKGMYVLTEIQNIQTKLFDYTELINKKDRVDVIDIDNDGDKDYIFILGDKLYVKKTYLKSPEKIIDLKTKTEKIAHKIPEVPNNFQQTLSTPSELNASFRNVVSGEKEWRMEFYDSYLEWDKTAMDKDIYTKNPRSVVDFFLKNNFENFDENGVSSYPIQRYLASGHNASSFKLVGPRIEKIFEKIFISVSPNRTIYTGKNNAHITYKTASNPEERTLTLLAHRAYQFSDTTEIRASGGPIFVIGEGSGEYHYSSLDDLIGLPILPGMQLTSEDGFVIYDNTHRENISLPKNSLYMVKNLGIESEMYNFNIPYPNGFYYAKLYHLSQNKNNRAGVVLLSPQIASDSSNPVISLSERIRVPVYVEKKFPISDFVTELSHFTIQIDENMNIDSDANGVYDDDFDSARNHVKISDQEIIFGPFDAPENRSMMMKVRDDYGNTTLFPFVVEVYTPIPNLENVSSDGYLSGILNESIATEPIDIFRIRASEYPILINSGSILTDNEGRFASGSYRQEERIIGRSHTDTFRIKKTGIFENIPDGYEVRVSPANANHPMKMEIFNIEKIPVYEQFISLPSTARILEKNAQNNSSTGNLLISPASKYRFVSAHHNDPTIPGGAYIADSENNAVLMVAYDGNIYALQEHITLHQSEKGGFLLITARRGSEVIAEFHYMMDFFYTTK